MIPVTSGSDGWGQSIHLVLWTPGTELPWACTTQSTRKLTFQASSKDEMYAEWNRKAESSDRGAGIKYRAQSSLIVKARRELSSSGMASPEPASFCPSGRTPAGGSGESSGLEPKTPKILPIPSPRLRGRPYLTEREESVGRQPHGAGDSGERAQRDPRAAEAEL